MLQMRRFARALLLSVITISLLAWIVHWLRRGIPARRTFTVDADRLLPEVQQRLLDELDRLL